MFDLGYKDHWQGFYDWAIEELGMDEKAAGKYADDHLADHYAGRADALALIDKYSEPL